MTQKINGAAYPGVWMERKVSFVKLTFSKDIAALADTDLTVLGTSTAAPLGTVASSVFGVVESALVQALKTLETKATLLGVSSYDAATFSVDAILGVSEGWFADAAGMIADNVAVLNAQAATAAGVLYSVKPAAVTVDLRFAAFNGTMEIGTAANGVLVNGPGATPGYHPASI